MMEAEFDVLPLRVIRVRSNGKRDFDRTDKRRIVEACLQPGVSVSGMALKLGINTNQLRKWIRLHQVAKEAAAATGSTLPAFVPVVAASEQVRPKAKTHCRPNKFVVGTEMRAPSGPIKYYLQEVGDVGVIT